MKKALSSNKIFIRISNRITVIFCRDTTKMLLRGIIKVLKNEKVITKIFILEVYENLRLNFFARVKVENLVYCITTKLLVS